jgi:hypothetical protein
MGRQHQANGFRAQPAGHKGDDLHRGAVEPLYVIDQANQGLFLRDVGEHAQHCQPDQKPVRCRPSAHAERRAQGIALWSGQMLQTIQDRCAQLLQTGVCELHLRLHTGRAGQATARGLPGQIIQQRRLAHARLTVHHKSPAFTGADGREESVQHIAFGAPADQLHFISRWRGAAITRTASTLYLTSHHRPGQHAGRYGQPLADATADPLAAISQ